MLKIKAFQRAVLVLLCSPTSPHNTSLLHLMNTDNYIYVQLQALAHISIKICDLLPGQMYVLNYSRQDAAAISHVVCTTEIQSPTVA